VTGVADAAKTFLLASSAWWGRVQGCGCGCSVGRVHCGPSIDQHLSLCIFVFLTRARCHVREYKLTDNLKNARLRGSARESAPPRRTNSSQLQATSHPPTSHIRCVPSAYPFHLQHESESTPPPLSLPVTCFPHVCQITAGFVKPAGIALFRHLLFSSVLTYHPEPHHSLATAVHP
jgi:hypothetical protein